MTNWINYHHLFYFKIIVEEGSISKAALKLSLGQPTLSEQLKQFEEALGLKLFEREHKKLKLTEQGKVAFDYAQTIFKIGSEMYEVLHDRLKPLKESLHIGCLDSIPKQIVVSLVKQALKITPCQITLSEGKFDELLRELTAHRIDLVITNFLPSGLDSKGLGHKLIAKNNVSFYGSSHFALLKKNFPESISKVPLILPTYDSKLRQDLDHWAKVNKIELNIIIESQDIAVKKSLAIQGLGLIPTAEHAVVKQTQAKELVKLGSLQGVHEELYLLWAHRKIENQVAARLKDVFSIS